MAEKNIYEVTNPVFNTAKMTSYFLSESGNAYAKAIIDRTGFDDELAFQAMPAFQIFRFPNLVAQDVRYEAVNRLVRQAGNRHVLDLACGFSPRGLELSAEGYTYMGGDLQMVVPVIEPIIKELAGDRADRIGYTVVDVTDRTSCMAAADKIGEGPVTVITEGLMPYLNPVEKKTVFQNIAAILKKYGGCYITPDFNDNRFALQVSSVLMGEDAVRAVAETQKQYSSKGDSDTAVNMKSPLEEARGILAESPLRAEFLSIFPQDAWAASYSMIDEDKLAAYREAMARGVMLRCEYRDGPAESESGKRKKEFTLHREMRGGSIFYTLTGRLDSLTAPRLAEDYMSIPDGDACPAVHFEIGDLEYISSAGLRVLLMIKKKAPDRTVTLHHTGQTVRDILATTGFDLFFAAD